MPRLSDLVSQLAAVDRWLPDLLRRPWLVYVALALIFLLSLGIRTGYGQTVFSLYVCVSLIGGYFGGFRRGIAVTGLGTLGLVLAALASPSTGQHVVDVVLGALTLVLIGGLVSYLSDQGLQGLRQARALAESVDAYQRQVTAATVAATQATSQLAEERKTTEAQRRADAEATAAAKTRAAELDAALQKLRNEVAAERQAGAQALAAANATRDELRGLATKHEEAARKAIADLADAQRRLAQLTEEHARREDERRRNDAQSQRDAATQNKSLLAQVSDLQARGRDLEKALAEAHQAQETLQQELRQRADEVQRARAAQRQVEQKLQELQAAQEKEHTAHRAALEQLSHHHDQACAARDQLQAESSASRKTVDALTQNLETVGRERDELREQHAATSRELAELRRRHDEAGAVHEQLRGQVQELQEDSRRLRNARGVQRWLTDRLHPALTRAGRAAEVAAAAPLDTPGRAFAALIDDALRPALFAVEAATLAERLARGEVVAERQPVALETLVQRAVNAVDRFVATQGQHLTVRLPLGTEWLRGDVNLLTHALTQLLDNAARYAGAEAAINLAVHRDGTRLMFAITDDGLGLPPEVVDALPQLSAREGEYWTDGHASPGLGLALARDIADIHGGRLDVRAGHGGLLLELPAPPNCAPCAAPPLDAVEEGMLCLPAQAESPHEAETGTVDTHEGSRG